VGLRVLTEHNGAGLLLAERARERYDGVSKQTRIEGRRRSGTNVVSVPGDSHSFAALCKSPANLDPLQLDSHPTYRGPTRAASAAEKNSDKFANPAKIRRQDDRGARPRFVSPTWHAE